MNFGTELFSFSLKRSGLMQVVEAKVKASFCNNSAKKIFTLHLNFEINIFFTNNLFLFELKSS